MKSQKTLFSIIIIATLLANVCYAKISFTPLIEPIPKALQNKMLGKTYKSSCPVLLKDLRLLTLPYWGFDAKTHKGQLIVNKYIATETVTIFEKLYQQKFPIQRMQLMVEFNGNDELAMAQNNTSAFNCRPITGKRKQFSKHAYGLAIDINTRINPYIKGKTILPHNASQYVSRKTPMKGKIINNDFVYQLFISNGWHWGGDWQSLKDYQHFEKKLPTKQ